MWQWWQIFFCFFGRFGVLLTATVSIVLILSASSRTKETAVIAGACTQSTEVDGSDIGGRITEYLNIFCSSSRFFISCGELIFSGYLYSKNHQNQFPHHFFHYQTQNKHLKASCNYKSFLYNMFFVAVFSMKLN